MKQCKESTQEGKIKHASGQGKTVTRVRMGGQSGRARCSSRTREGCRVGQV